MGSEIIAYYDYLLLVPYTIIFFLIARRFAKKHAETSNEFYWLLLNWWIKMIAGILYAWMIVYYYKYGDPLGYKDRSDALFDSILKNWENIKYLFLPSESFKDYLISTGYSLPDNSYLGYYAESTFMTSRVSCVVAFFTFNRFLLISFVFTNLAYYGFVVIYTTSKKIIKGYNKQLAIGCLFIPSCIFWSSGLAKEPICIICLGVLFSYTVKWFFEKKINFQQILLFTFLSYILFTVKSYIFLCFAFAVFIWIFYDRFKKLMLKNAVIMSGAILILLTTTAAAAYFFSNNISVIISENIGNIISSNISMYESMATLRQGGGSLIDVNDIDVSSVGGVLKFIPQGFINVFFRPFPWEISNVLMVFTVLENLFFIFLLIKVLIKSRIFTRKLFINKNYQVFAIVFSITFALMVGISTFNFGSMVRYKMPYLPFWASFLLVVNKKLSNNKRTVDYKS
jgi:hypothetical protein